MLAQAAAITAAAAVMRTSHLAIHLAIGIHTPKTSTDNHSGRVIVQNHFTVPSAKAAVAAAATLQQPP